MSNFVLLSSLSGLVSGLSQRLQALLTQTKQRGSIARLSSAAQIQPITLIDSSLEFNERLDDVLHVCINMYAAFYIQALALTNTTVKSTQIIKRLEKVNPTLRDVALGFESLGVAQAILPDNELEFNLPSLESYQSYGISLENRSEDGKKAKDDDEEEDKRYNRQRKLDKRQISYGKASDDVLRDQPELAVGKLINVELRSDGESFNVPISIRLASTAASSQTLVNAMSHRFKSEQTALEREVKWRTGSIKLIADVILCRDLVREHYKNLISDKDGIYAKLTPRRSRAYTNALRTGETTVAQASSILIISKETADRVEAITGGKFSRPNFRTNMLEATGVMILVIVDQNHDQITFYIDNLAQEQVVSGRNLSRSSKKDGPDVQDILRSLVEGRGGFLR